MIWGIIFACLGVLLLAVASTLMKYISVDGKPGAQNDVIHDLVLNHTTMAISALLIVSIFSFPNILPSISGLQDWLFVAGMCVIGYIGIRAFLKGMEKGKAGIVMVVASLNVFIGYGLNIYFFPEVEELSLIKIGLSVLFFVVIALFIFDKQGLSECNTDHCDVKALEKATRNSYLIYPVITAFSWAFFFGMTNYFIKSGKMTPYQSMFVGEFLVGVMAIIVYAFARKANFGVFFRMKVAQIWPYIAIGLTNVGGATFMCLAYAAIAGNTVNVVRLVQIPLVALLSWFFLGDLLTKKQKVLIGVAVGILGVFVMV